MKRLCFLLSVLVLTSGGAGIARAEPSAPAPRPSLCRDVPGPFVAQVPKPRRSDAMRLLSGKEVVGLTDQQAADLIGEPVGHTSLALSRLDSAISQMTARRQAALKTAEGSWSISDDEELAHLKRRRARTSARPPRPFLVRAILGFEETGGFTVQQCGDLLEVLHGSLGRSNPKPQSAPVIVLLSRTPARIHADFSVAE